MISIANFGDSRVAGRLGNQIFQFALLFSIHKEKKYSICLQKIKEAQFWKCFDVKNVKIHECKENYFEYGIEEDKGCYNFDEDILKQPDKVIFCGFFQSYRYFDKYKKELINCLKFKNHIIKKGNSELKKYKKNPVSIHVRRTDYLSHPVWGDLIKEGYYKKACKFIDKNDDVLVFSDDVNFVKEYFKNKKNYHIIDQNEYVSLYMMTKCKQHIIANSSFSWMGAYLSGKENIICPNPWFPSFFPKPNNIQKDITKPKWKKINVFK